METIGVTLPEAKKIIIRYSLFAAGLYIAYFLIMMIFNLEVRTELRFFNYFLYFFAGYQALKKLRMERQGDMKYLQGLGIGFATGAISFIILGVFIFLYCLLNPSFLNNVTQNYPYQFLLGPFSALFLVASEGIAMSAVISLCLMQYFRIFTGQHRRFLFFGRKIGAADTVNES